MLRVRRFAALAGLGSEDIRCSEYGLPAQGSNSRPVEHGSDALDSCSGPLALGGLLPAPSSDRVGVVDLGYRLVQALAILRGKAASNRTCGISCT